LELLHLIYSPRHPLLAQTQPSCWSCGTWFTHLVILPYSSSSGIRATWAPVTRDWLESKWDGRIGTIGAEADPAVETDGIIVVDATETGKNLELLRFISSPCHQPGSSLLAQLQPLLL
jgi:hypothetical protein